MWQCSQAYECPRNHALNRFFAIPLRHSTHHASIRPTRDQKHHRLVPDLTRPRRVFARVSQAWNQTSLPLLWQKSLLYLEDVHWMFETWPRLQSGTGRLHSKKETNATLQGRKEGWRRRDSRKKSTLLSVNLNDASAFNISIMAHSLNHSTSTNDGEEL